MHFANSAPKPRRAEITCSTRLVTRSGRLRLNECVQSRSQLEWSIEHKRDVEEEYSSQAVAGPGNVYAIDLYIVCRDDAVARYQLTRG